MRTTAATRIVALALTLLLTAACSSSGSDEDEDNTPTAQGPTPTTPGTAAPTAQPPAGGAEPVLPPIGAQWDYQIGGAYQPAAGVRIVSRDSGADPAAGLYNICYINAFQAQPGSTAWWQSNHPDLLLRDSSGALVLDKDWHEPLLDVSTDAKRDRLAQVEYPWIDGCAAKGFQAVEPDNLDSYGRSGGLLKPADNIAFASLLAQRAHRDGLAIGQKNATELLDRHQAIGFDFAVAEQCGATDECDQYASAYGNRVVDVEYDDAGFASACKSFASRISIVRRDHDVSAPPNGKYARRTC
ncbi:endo alpha-1,4 polygalactosaminidase [Embleya sp. NPDC059259]|uniref:endo alpha-1,4 polygalactosaminidase n=1 Tax=unclassified Embleya TaxID=2699296 RepID=UPI00368A208F